MGLLSLSSGYIKIFNEDLNQVRNKVSYVPQRESVDWDFPASVFDIVLMGRYGQLKAFQKPRKADKEIALDCLRKVGMEEYKDRQISQLSGGQQQRVFIARSLAQNADVYLMDEPFAGVDMATEAKIIEILKSLRDEGKTVIVVHHDLQSAKSYFDWMIMINLRLVASGPTSEVFNPENLEKTYGGRLNLLSKLGDLMEKNQFPSRE